VDDLAQALSSLAPIAPVRNSRRIVGGALGRAGAGPSGSIRVGRNALGIISSLDQSKIVSSAQAALGLIRGRWKIAILVTMLDGPVRLGQLRRLIPHVSKKVLIQQLHELARAGIIVRTDLSEKIKHVEYTISAPLGVAVTDLLGLIFDWGNRHPSLMALQSTAETGARPTSNHSIELVTKRCVFRDSGNRHKSSAPLHEPH
jgi:DNA-binding HxlR family transcriptional regulator